MSYGNQTLKDCIFVEKNIIPESVCQYIIETIDKRDWRPHSWYNVNNNSFNSEETMELDVQTATDDLNSLLVPYIIQAGALYNEKFSNSNNPRTLQIMNKFSRVRFNRYGSGQIMREHYDHIHSLFDGNEKGIPVLSFVLNFNGDYEGGELQFWGDFPVKLGCGDIIMFPSLFLYPHGVNEVTKGKRYSGVCWAW
jgi:predicted 2-oxoglutarate/Fe(II)-dependent dioxygenase YbiX